MLISLHTSAQELTKVYKAASGSLPVDFAPGLSSADLVAIIKQHDNKPYSAALYEAIPLQENSGDEVFKKLLKAKSFDNGVASAIATSGKASVGLLKQLIKKGSRQVAQHAQLALVRKQLDENTPVEIEQLFSTYSNRDDEFAITVRYLLASYPKTPTTLLAELAQDDYEHVMQAALININYKKLF